ncbi:hypothetical protein AK812_SmicGene46013 [Symbiodinium microadriaticum]|uniref:Uncharacterized protein n=1 Tax=Symbiodinium microadriaticum TaxID=2951 RepID=A0A1Q9BUV8_SYMMI|nr:hypothetical protein AK812_SmicGene46013 [Symbiodinium microadriaticum]
MGCRLEIPKPEVLTSLKGPAAAPVSNSSLVARTCANRGAHCFSAEALFPGRPIKGSMVLAGNGHSQLEKKQQQKK